MPDTCMTPTPTYLAAEWQHHESLTNQQETEMTTPITKEQFLAFYRSESYGDLAPEEKEEVFLTSLHGGRDITLRLLAQLLSEYDITWEDVFDRVPSMRLYGTGEDIGDSYFVVEDSASELVAAAVDLDSRVSFYATPTEMSTPEQLMAAMIAANVL